MRAITSMSDGLVHARPIGAVRSPVGEPQTGGFTELRATVVIDPDLEPLLQGIDEFSHIWVLFWMTDVRECTAARRPQGRDDVPVTGILGTRCPDRPNPIGLTLVRLIERRGNELAVEGLDAVDGTPVLDVKPFYPPYDVPKEPARV